MLDILGPFATLNEVVNFKLYWYSYKLNQHTCDLKRLYLDIWIY